MTALLNAARPRRPSIISGFWFLGRDRDSRRVVHIQAVGLINLGNQNLAGYLQDHAWLYHPYGEDVCPQYCSFPARGARQITGQVCYQGELWVRPGRDGFQGQGLARKLVRMAILLGYELFSPDYLWAFISERKARARFPQRWGYANCQSDGVVWRNADHEELMREWLIWSSRPELVELAAEERNADVLGRVAKHDEDRLTVR
jgi:hypothetical protein